MSVESRAFRGASWLALFKIISQLFSWFTTIIVARILAPEDYAIMDMATVITGYAMVFSELGLGGAIIQRKEPTNNELSSIFWFGFIVSSILAIACFPIAHPTALIFREPKVIPLVRAVSVLFIISGLQIVPLNLLKKELDFKAVGKIEMIGILVSCIAMLAIAHAGGGVWTLLGGHIIRNFVKLLLIYKYVTWRPRFRFQFKEVKPYLKFGLPIVSGGSISYIYERSDKFFAGRAWEPRILGYYSLAKQLSRIPTDKIVSLINQVSFPAFSKLQGDNQRFNDFYLKTVKITAIIVFPLFVGGFLVGEDIIKVLFSEKWYPMTFVFRYLCLVEIITSLNAINNFVHGAQGRPSWFLYFNIILAALMPVSFYFGVMYGLNGILIPWLGTYSLISLAWIVITLRKIGIKLREYLKALCFPVLLTTLMSFFVWIVFKTKWCFGVPMDDVRVRLMIEISVGAFAYGIGMVIVERRLLQSLLRLRLASSTS